MVDNEGTREKEGVEERWGGAYSIVTFLNRMTIDHVDNVQMKKAAGARENKQTTQPRMDESTGSASRQGQREGGKSGGERDGRRWTTPAGKRQLVDGHEGGFSPQFGACGGARACAEVLTWLI